jgi:hypothetical protein
MQKFTGPIGDRGVNGLGCDICGNPVDFSQGYYNCNQECNWDACAKCVEKYCPVA